MNTIIKAFIFAFIAAIGNAVFVYGQKKSVPDANPFIFLAFALGICFLILLVSTVSFPMPDIKAYIILNWKAFVITAVGLFITYLGFYLLYSRFGASYYIIYAVTSIVTTSIIVGVVVFKEKFNVYYLLSTLSAVLTIVLFFIGQQRGK